MAEELFPEADPAKVSDLIQFLSSPKMNDDLFAAIESVSELFESQSRQQQSEK